MTVSGIGSSELRTARGCRSSLALVLICYGFAACDASSDPPSPDGAARLGVSHSAPAAEGAQVGGAGTMRASRVRARFAQAVGEESETAFAEELLEEARISARTLVDLWHSPDDDLADRALRILVDLEEQAVIPLAERAVEFEPTDRVEALQIVIEAEVALRQRVAAALEAMLDDLRPRGRGWRRRRSDRRLGVSATRLICRCEGWCTTARTSSKRRSRAMPSSTCPKTSGMRPSPERVAARRGIGWCSATWSREAAA